MGAVSPVVPLDDRVRDQGLRAMFAFLMERDPRTTDLVSSVAVSRGVVDAAESLGDALEIDPAGWAQWLSDPDHANAAASMTMALDDDVFASLRYGLVNSSLVTFLDSSRQALAATKSIAVEYAKQIDTNSQEITIDLRNRHLNVVEYGLS